AAIGELDALDAFFDVWTAAEAINLIDRDLIAADPVGEHEVAAIVVLGPSRHFRRDLKRGCGDAAAELQDRLLAAAAGLRDFQVSVSSVEHKGVIAAIADH